MCDSTKSYWLTVPWVDPEASPPIDEQPYLDPPQNTQKNIRTYAEWVSVLQVGSNDALCEIMTLQPWLFEVADNPTPTPEEVHLNVDNEYASSTGGRKLIPIGADRLLIEDSESTYRKAYIEIGDLPSGGGGGSGDVVGPASSTDNALVRFDGTTGKLVQNSAITASDAGVVTAPGFIGSLTGSVTGGTVSALTAPIAVADGGTGAATLTGVVVGSGAGAMTAQTSSTVGQVLRVTGGNTYAFGAVDLADGDAITGVLPDANIAATIARDSEVAANYQPLDADLTAIAGLVSAADKGIQFTGAGTAGLFDLTAAGRALLDDADATAQRTTLGLGTISTQDASAVAITGGTIAGITDLAVADGGTGASTAAAAATNLGLGATDSPQFTAINVGNASDTTITRVSAGDIAVEGNMLYRAGGADVPLTDGGTGASTASGARANLGLGTAALLNEEVVFASGDVTSSSGTFADITGMTVAADANATYSIDIRVLAECSSTSGGLLIALNGPTFNYFGAQFSGVQTGPGNASRNYIIAYDDVGTTVGTVQTANQEYLITYSAVVRTNAAGTFAARLARGGSAGTMTVRAVGTAMKVRKIQ